MAIIKCKMCGGDLELIEGSSVCECEYCGTKQTVPTADNDKKLTLFARANRLRAANEFDKAAGVYESIVADFPEEAEAYWGLVLCRYGIEYVDDPATGKKIPTCHRSSFDSVLKDSDFEQACENADAVARRQYREEAKQIEDIRRSIIEVSGKEEPYDIFICYKETDENGERTIDSVLAQDVYDALVDKGYRVFFSRVSLEDKLGTEYEPHIFAALSSAKIMLALGTDYEHYNAVWVKNEWSRFLKLMAKDKSKHLIPCYKNLDPYDIPDEFQRLQAQDLGKVGAVQDLLRGIEKILSPKTNQPAEPVVQQVIQGGGPNVTALLQRGQMALEDREWDSARNYFDQALNMDAQSAEAYLGLLLADFHLTDVEAIQTVRESLDSIEGNFNYKRFKRFTDAARGQQVDGFVEAARRDADQEEAEVKAQSEAKKTQLAPIRDRIAAAKGIITISDLYTVGLRADGTVVACGSNDKRQCNVDAWTDIVAVATEGFYTIGLKADGTVVACGENNYGQCNVDAWSDIAAVATGEDHTVGLKADGTVVSCGSNSYGELNVDTWTDIVAIAAGGGLTVGLKADGTVLACGFNKLGQCDVDTWKEILAISVGYRADEPWENHTVGLKADGSVVACGDNKYGQCNVDAWTDIVAVATRDRCTVGLKADGTVVACGDNEDGRCNVDDWTDIVAVATGFFGTIGLKADGTVVACGNDKYDVDAWTDIVAVVSGCDFAVGLKEDGTVVACGSNEYGRCNVDGWKLFRNLDTLEEEQKEAREKVEREAAEAKARAEREAAVKEKAREDRYLWLCQRQEEATFAKDFYIIARSFESTEMQGYKDSNDRARLVRQKAHELDAAERAERERRERISTLTAERTSLETELSSLKGLFTGKRRKQIEARLGELREELNQLNQ